MKILNNIAKFFGVGQSTTKETKEEVVEVPRMRTGNRNGILSTPERNHANRQFNTYKKSRKKRKMANKARNLQHASA